MAEVGAQYFTAQSQRLCKIRNQKQKSQKFDIHTKSKL